ncbi:MAG: ATP-binding protein [Methanomicrobiaceae archaeon]|nr:ATP-binding protein [Methanomicrobiaceae archaeon]
MIRIAVVSGKGGTGKTVVTAALADIIPGSIVLADCDVDAANLSLVIPHETKSSRPYFGMQCAEIDTETCTGCGACRAHCRFDAIEETEKGGLKVNPLLCEGCGVCDLICPEGAVTMKPRMAGEIFASSTSRGPLSHARLFPGAGTSGLLVQEVKQAALSSAGDMPLMLIDGPPGIGCPAVATLSGMDAAIIVTEPSISAVHDLRRLVQLCRGFQIRLFLVINRADLEPEMTASIREYCAGEDILVLGTIPFDPAVLSAVRAGKPVTADSSPAAMALREIRDALYAALGVPE